MTTKSSLTLRLAQIDLHRHVPTVAYLDILFGRLRAAGYTAVLLAYRDKFPYTTYPELAAPDAYTPEEVAAIDSLALRHGLDIVPLGFQFSHSAAIVKQPRFKHLAGDGGGLNLLDPQSVEVMAKSSRDILKAHPRANLLHVGGDEIGGIGSRPAIGRFVREHGASAYVVRYVNALAAEMRKDGVRLGIWSDMLIRYPQDIASLDKSVVMFYWDYWSYGDRTPFVTIGGGLPDFYVLDRTALTGDIKKLFLAPWPKPADDIPAGHLRQFASYWQMAADGKSVRSFPYAAWFRDQGLDVVGALLTYPEKSSFLPDFLGKFDHVRGFARRLRESGGLGCLACLWALYFPLPETVWPSWLAASILMDDPERTDAEVCALAAARLGGHWTPATLQAYFGVGRDFELADLMAPTWSIKLTLAERLQWLREAGALEEDMALCRGSLQRAEALLDGPWNSLPPDTYERFMVEDLAWRARLQIAWQAGDAGAVPVLKKEGLALEQRCGAFLAPLYKTGHDTDLVAARYQPWLQFLDTLSPAAPAAGT